MITTNGVIQFHQMAEKGTSCKIKFPRTASEASLTYDSRSGFCRMRGDRLPASNKETTFEIADSCALDLLLRAFTAQGCAQAARWGPL